jgi:two-component SAPR family response regulator
VHGAITYNNELVSYVNWQGMGNYTSGKFTFPLESGGELSLDPKIPGYKVLPPRITVSNTSKKIYVNEFELRPLPIDDNLKVYMPFYDDVKDYSYNKNNGVPRDIDFIFDPVRGQVASFNNQSRVDLPQADKLQVKDHDFTVAVWLKIPRYISDKRDYSIMGTKSNAYQRGLHFLIRDRKPYMGFFNNDLEGNTVIEAGKWYHVAYRYNKLNGEQSIFVNGKLDAISFDRPAYLGSDTLYIGYAGLSSASNFVGVMDNFTLWSRVLSDKEILGFSNQLIDLNESSSKRKLNAILPPLLYLFIAICVLTVGFLSYRYIRKRKAKGGVTKEEEIVAASNAIQPLSIPKEKPQKNYIRLFGDFYVLDAEGVNITSSFTPKLKQLFLLIILYSQQDKTGIQSNELTEIIWGDDNIKSMKSLRSVSILKLRKILERLDKVEIIFNANKYAIEFSENVYCDYLVCLRLLNETKIRSKADFELFFDLISKGEIFKGESFDWLDDFKSYICNSIVDVLSKYIGKYSLHEEDDMIIKIADQILLNDPSNEEALVYKVKALVNQNNTKSAKYTYDKFCSLYVDMYGENFPLSFEKVIETT